MTTLNSKAIESIEKWAEKFNPAAGQALIDAAARSPYLSSQFNQFVANGGADSKVKCNTGKPRKVSRCKHHPGPTSNSSPKAA